MDYYRSVEEEWPIEKEKRELDSSYIYKKNPARPHANIINIGFTLYLRVPINAIKKITTLTIN